MSPPFFSRADHGAGASTQAGHCDRQRIWAAAHGVVDQQAAYSLGRRSFQWLTITHHSSLIDDKR